MAGRRLYLDSPTEVGGVAVLPSKNDGPTNRLKTTKLARKRPTSSIRDEKLERDCNRQKDKGFGRKRKGRGIFRVSSEK